MMDALAGIWFPSRSASRGEPPLYGTCCTSTLSDLRIWYTSSDARPAGLGVPMERAFGSRRMYVTYSAKFDGPRALLTVIPCGAAAALHTGTRSASESNAGLLVNSGSSDTAELGAIST